MHSETGHGGTGARGTAPGTGLAEIVWQRFSVSFDYPLAPGNPPLADMLARSEPAKRHRCLVYLHDNLARPVLAAEIGTALTMHAARWPRAREGANERAGEGTGGTG